MEVRCSSCSTEYEFDDALVSARGTSVKCTNCGHQFRVHAPAAVAGVAEKWIVRDSRGKERVRLTAYETGGVPKLSVLNEKGQTVFSMGVCEKNKGYIEVTGASGLARSSFVVQDGRAILEPVAAGEKTGEPRAGM